MTDAQEIGARDADREPGVQETVGQTHRAQFAETPPPGVYRQILPPRYHHVELELSAEGTYRWGADLMPHEVGSWTFDTDSGVLALEGRLREPLTDERYRAVGHEFRATSGEGVLLWWDTVRLAALFARDFNNLGDTLNVLPVAVRANRTHRIQGTAGTLHYSAQRLIDGRIDTAWAAPPETEGETTLYLSVPQWIREPRIAAVVLVPPRVDGPLAVPAAVTVSVQPLAQERPMRPATRAAVGTQSPTVVRFEAPLPTSRELRITVEMQNPTDNAATRPVGFAEILVLGTTPTRYYFRSSEPDLSSYR